MKKLYALALICIMPALYAGSLEKTVSQEQSKIAFSKERSDELHSLRGKIITAQRKGKIGDMEKVGTLALHDLWCHNKVQFSGLTIDAHFINCNSVLTSLASLDQTIFDTLKKFEKDMDSRQEKKS